MLEGAKFWPKGYIELLDIHDVKKFYVSSRSIDKTYNHIQNRIKKQGSIPVGIDHIPESILNQFPILKKMDVLHVGDITDVELIDNEIYIKKANIFNPTIQKLYEAGELTSLSMVGYMQREPCEQDPNVMYVIDNDIIRVDIVDEGACETCKLPPPNQNTGESGSMKASKFRIPLKLEAKNMAEPNIKPNEPQEPETNEEEVSTLGKLIKQLEGIVKMLKKEDNEEENNEPEAAAEQPPSVNNVAASQASSADAVMASKVEQLEKEIETYKKAQASAYVEQLVSAGKVAPANKEHYVKLAEADMESVQAIMASAPVQFSMNQESLQANASQPFTENVDLDDPENIISSFEALDKED